MCVTTLYLLDLIVLRLNFLYFISQNYPFTREWNEVDWLDPLVYYLYEICVKSKVPWLWQSSHKIFIWKINQVLLEKPSLKYTKVYVWVHWYKLASTVEFKHELRCTWHTLKTGSPKSRLRRWGKLLKKVKILGRVGWTNDFSKFFLF